MSITSFLKTQVSKAGSTDLAKSLKIKETLKASVGAAKEAATGRIAQSVTESSVIQEQAKKAIEAGTVKSMGEWAYKNKTSVYLGLFSIVLLSVAGFMKYRKATRMMKK